MYKKKKNEKDVRYILDNLRDEDLEETKAVYGEDWKEEVYKSIMETDFDVLIGVTKKGDIPVAIGGAWHLRKDAPDVAVVWMLSTDEIVNHKVCLLRELRKELENYHKKYRVLYNFIYYKNFIAKNWLKWMGFKFDNPKPEGFDIPDEFEFFYKVK